jgi:hypothetical protein
MFLPDPLSRIVLRISFQYSAPHFSFSFRIFFLVFPFVLLFRFPFFCPSTFFFTFSLYPFSPVRLLFFSPFSSVSLLSHSIYVNYSPFICIFLYPIFTLFPLSLSSLAISLYQNRNFLILNNLIRFRTFCVLSL